MKRTIAQMEQAVGGLSQPSKMPGHAWSTPAERCKVGSLLRAKAGSVCSSCYALKGRYVFPNVQAALRRRLAIYRANPEDWVDNMVAVINARAHREPWFRWHDSGDIQSVAHLVHICRVAERTPMVRHWLPTRERAMVHTFLQQGRTFPDNLTVRLSAPMVGQLVRALPGTTTSSVDAESGRKCPAPTQGNSCGDCRACWDRNTENVDYTRH